MRSHTRTRTLTALALASALALAACQDSSEPQEPDDSTTSEETSDPDETDDSGSGESGGSDESAESDDSGDAPDTGDDEDTGSADTEPAEETDGSDRIDADDLEGEDSPMFFSEEGIDVNVVGVEEGDVLFVREVPDATSGEVHRLGPTVTATLAGRERSVTHGQWAELELSEGYGWVNTVYLGYLGLSTDRTGDFQDVPPTTDPTELIRSLVGEATADITGEGGPEVTWVIIDSNTDGDLHEYTVDVLGYPDDSQRGERLRLFLQPQGDGVRLHSAESTQICGRGETQGLCT